MDPAVDTLYKYTYIYIFDGYAFVHAANIVHPSYFYADMYPNAYRNGTSQKHMADKSTTMAWNWFYTYFRSIIFRL